jgi:hypothetical protein
LKLAANLTIDFSLRALNINGATQNDTYRLNNIGSRSTKWSNYLGSRTKEIFCHKWTPFVTDLAFGSTLHGAVLPCGNYEWPFELVLNGSLPESIEGLAEASVTYKIKATLVRGKLVSDMHAWKPVRIIRTLGPTALELSHATTVEGIWTSKIEYSVTIPQRVIVFGTAISIDMKFTPLLVGLKIGHIECVLLEILEFTLPAYATRAKGGRKQSRPVEVWSFEIGEEQDPVEGNGQPSYITCQKTLPLPKELRTCLQDANACGIKIWHKMQLNIALHNPDGHISEVSPFVIADQIILISLASCPHSYYHLHLSKYGTQLQWFS